MEQEALLNRPYTSGVWGVGRPKPPSAAPIQVDGVVLNSALSPGDIDLANGGASSQPATTLLQQPALDPENPRAVIIETIIIPSLVPIMLHFASVLGPSWGMILFTLEEHWIEPRSPAFQRHLVSGRIEVRFLPKGTELVSSQSVSRFLTGPWLWEQLAQATRVLLFQSDSVLCSRSEALVEDFFQYDYIGAPIDDEHGEGFNGGLSLRNPKMFLQVAREVDFASSVEGYEDQFFYQELKKRGAELPTEEVAMTFAVETIFHENPLGYHQPQRWQADKIGVIEEWCPEVKLLIGRRAEWLHDQP